MNAGWTLISSPLFEGSINAILGDIAGLARDNTDLIKNQYHFANYISTGPAVGWFGQLTTLSPLEGYKVRLVTGGVATFTGVVADVTGRTIPMNQGWTLIGWPSLSAAPLTQFNDALADPSTLRAHDSIKSQYFFSSYIPDYGWFGNLQQFEAGMGYMVKLSAANSLVSFGAPLARRKRQLDAKGDTKRDATPVAKLDAKLAKLPHAADNKPASGGPVVTSGEWSLAPAEFESSMCMVIIVLGNDNNVKQDGDLATFLKGELRGIAHPSSYLAPVGPYKGYKAYNLMAYGGRDEEGLGLSFEYRHADGKVSTLKPLEPTYFHVDAFAGTVSTPFVLSAV